VLAFVLVRPRDFREQDLEHAPDEPVMELAA